MQSKAATVDDYVKSLPPDRRDAINAVRAVIRKNLDKDIVECMQYGMIGYAIPHSVFPPGYHCDPKQPLPYAGLASQKNHMSMYMMTVYGDSDHWKWFDAAWRKTGKKLDMGKCCIRFKKLDDLALDVIGEAIKRVSAKAYIKVYQEALGDRAVKKGAKKVAKAPAKKATPSAKPRTGSPANRAQKAATKKKVTAKRG